MEGSRRLARQIDAGLNMTLEIHDLDDKSLRRFGFVTGAMVVGLFGLVLPWLFDRPYPVWPWVLAGLLWLGSLLCLPAIRPVYRIWMRIGLVLGWVNTWLILGLIFFVVVVPMGLSMRLFGRDPMARRFDADAETYRVKSANLSKDNLTRPF